MELSGWGRYPRIDSEVLHPLDPKDVLRHLCGTAQGPLIARGLDAATATARCRLALSARAI